MFLPRENWSFGSGKNNGVVPRPLCENWRPLPTGSTMKPPYNILISGIMAFSPACSDANREVVSEPSIEVSTTQFHRTDTIRFVVANPTPMRSFLSSNYDALTFWLQNLDRNHWPEHPINTGPYHNLDERHLILFPFQRLSLELPLSTLKPLPPGKYRIRINYATTESAPFQRAYSGVFQIVD